MKIVALHTDFRVYWPARLKYLSRKLQERGDDLFVVEVAGKGSIYAFAGHDEDSSITWICLYPDDRIEDVNPTLAKKAIIAKLNELNPDVVLSGAIAFESGAAAIDWTKAHDKAVVTFDDSKLEDVKRNYFINTVKKIVYSYVDAIFCPSKEWLDTYIYWRFKKEAVFYGVDVVDNAFWQQGSKFPEILEEYPDYFLCVGRQIKRKNFQMVIDTFQSMQLERRVDLVFVGEGPERVSLESSVIGEVKNRVHFIPFQDQESLRSIYKHAMAFILPSCQEQWGLVVNEAMASGLPVIVSNRCGSAHPLVKQGKNGFHFSPDNILELRSCMEKVTKLSPEEMNAMKQESLKIISKWGLDRFSESAMAAIDYSLKNKRKPFYFLGKYLLRKWNGRYKLA